MLCAIILFLLVILLFLGCFPSLLDGYFLAVIMVTDEREAGEKVV
jgi:hypothetical protein